MHSRRRGTEFATAACLVVLAALAHRHLTAQDAQQPPSFRAGVNYVRVDVIALDRNGRVVLDLKPEDFEIREAGTRQTIDTFKVIALNGGLNSSADTAPRPIGSDEIEAAEAARDDVRLFAIFLDDYHVKSISSLWVRQQLARFIETQIGQTDMVGLMYPLESLNAVRMTRNHPSIRDALMQFRGRKYDYNPMNEVERRYIYRVPALEVERIRNRASFEALKALILQLGALKEGRKSLVLVTEGYSNTLPAAMVASYGGLGSATGMSVPQAGGRGLTVPDSATFFEAVDINTDLREIDDLANRHNVSIYTVDPRGLATEEFGAEFPNIEPAADRQQLRMTMDTLRVLAEDGDGRAIVNRNDITMAMKPIVTESSGYYLIGYDSTVGKPDGKFHPIDVRVTRPGLQIRHRRGYWAWKPEEARAPAAPSPATSVAANRVASSIGTLTVPPARPIRTWIGGERGAEGKTRVTFVWESAASNAARPADQRPSRVVLTATGTDGATYFRGPVSSVGTAPVAAAFDAVPGPLNLRLSIEAANGDLLDSESRSITIKDLTAPNAVGSPELFRARTLPEWQRLTTDRNAIPTAVPEFRRTDRMLLRVPLPGSALSPPFVARLVTRADQPIATLAPMSPLDSRAQFEVALAALSPADYAIVLTSNDDGSVIEVVPFRVTP